jgi:molybdopterin synthase catalytic subunit
MGYLTHDPIDVSAWHRQTVDARDGASVEFLGLVRGAEDDQPIAALNYEAYAPMAEQMIGKLIEEAKARWGLHQVFVRHRVGTVGVGEIAVLIGVAAPHREQAFEACRFLIDAIKRDVPIWKTAVSQDGRRLHPTCADGHGTC